MYTYMVKWLPWKWKGLGKGCFILQLQFILIWRWRVLVGSEAYLALVTLITHEPRYTTSSDFKKRPSTGSGVTRRSGPSTSTKGSCKCPKDSIEHWISTDDMWLKAFDCTFLQLGKVDASKDQIKMDSQFHDVFVQAHWRLSHCQQNLTSHRCQPCRMIREIHVKDKINILGRVPSKLTAVLHPPKKYRKSWRKNWGLQNHGAQIKKYPPPFKGRLLSPPGCSCALVTTADGTSILSAASKAFSALSALAASPPASIQRWQEISSWW